MTHPPSLCLFFRDTLFFCIAAPRKVHELFVEHLKKSKVNVIGAFILANDVNRLQARH